MTQQPPRNLSECTALVNEAVAALLASDLSDEQKQHIATMANAYLYASRQAQTFGDVALEVVGIARETVAAKAQRP